MRMPAAPATHALTIQFSSATRSGEMPLTYAPVWDSADGPGQQTEPGEPEHRGEHQREHDDGDGQVEAVRQHRESTRASSARPGRSARR